jgi:hypothetical protein
LFNISETAEVFLMECQELCWTWWEANQTGQSFIHISQPTLQDPRDLCSVESTNIPEIRGHNDQRNVRYAGNFKYFVHS